MAAIVNLRQVRKRKRRADKERAANASRLEHGRPAAEENRTSLARDLDEKRLEGHRRRPPGEGDDNR